MEDVGQYLINHNISISTVESFTAGGFASSLGDISGISKVFKGGLITYQTIIKEDVLGIDHEVVEKYGVVSREVAGLMAIKGAEMFDSDLCVSFTGNAGPSAMEDKPVGMIFIGICYNDKINIFNYQLNGSRKQVKEQAIELAWYELYKILNTPSD